MSQRKKKVSQLPDSDLLQILAAFAQEATESMESKSGLRAGLYLRYIKEALDLRKVQAVAIDDVDLERDTIYLTEK